MKKFCKAIAIALVLFLTILLNNITNVLAANVRVSNYNTLSSNLRVGNNITLEDDIEFNRSISLSINGTGNILLDLNGHDLICNGNISTAMLYISSSSSRNTANIKIIDSQSNGKATHGFINSETNKANANSNCRAIQFMSTSVSGKVNLEVDGIKIDGFKTNGLGAAINIQAVSNQTEANLPDVIIKNSVITNNKSGNNGGAINLAKVNATLENNNISYNTAHSSGMANGGGLSILYSNLILKNNVIEHNQANSGGGLYFSTNSTYARNTGLQVILENNKINYNTVDLDGTEGLGGGLNLILEDNTDVDVQIKSGEFIGNVAKDGGAIYHGIVWANDHNSHDDTSKTIYLQKALITGNKAVRGGGIWLCPQAYLMMHTTLGGAIYNNTATGTFSNLQSGQLISAGDDVHYEGDNGDDKQYKYYPRSSITVSDRTWSGNLINWYKDAKDARYSASNRILASKDYYTNTTNTFSLHGEIEKEQKDATILIKDNVATQRGGGIFTNNLLVIGVNADYDIEVTKSFPDYDGVISDKAKVLVNLYQIDADGHEVLLDQNIELNNQNEWKHTFSNLPKYYLDASGNQHDYTYEIREADSENQVSTTCQNLNSTKTECTIENKYTDVPVQFSPEIEKEIVGNPTQKETFNFELKATAQDGLVLPNNTKLSLTGNGKALFEALTFTKVGTYTFTLNEIEGTNGQYIYDKTIWTIKVEVISKDGELAINQVTYIKNNVLHDKIIFENIYLEPLDFTPEISKKVEGNANSQDVFTFKLSAKVQKGMILPNKLETTIKGTGNVKFGNITFTQKGTYEFEVQEIAGKNNNYVYDPTIWKVIVVVDEKNNHLVISSVKYLKNNKNEDKIVFVNEYFSDGEGDIEPPKTLDNISTYTILASISLLSISFLLILKKHID